MVEKLSVVEQTVSFQSGWKPLFKCLETLQTVTKQTKKRTAVIEVALCFIFVFPIGAWLNLLATINIREGPKQEEN